MDNDNVAVKPVYISLPKKHMAALRNSYELDHGLFIKDLNSSLDESYVHAYFKIWGTITACKVKKSPDSGTCDAVAFVEFSTEEEADNADLAGPHVIEGTEVKVKRVVSLRSLI